MIVNIQALRALAALLVLCVHMATFATLLGWNEHATVFGNDGVDLFFVISGFIMMHTVIGRSTTAGAFLLNRVVRVVPLYWFMTLAVFVLASIAPSLFGNTRADWHALMLSLAFIPFDRGGGVVEPLFFLGWTLNYEMFFYACFALALWVARGRPTATMLMCSSLIGACVVIGWITAPTGILAHFYTNDLMLEFLFGVVIARATSSQRAPPAVIGLVMVVAGLAFMAAAGPLLHAPRWAVAGVAATVVLLGAVWAERGGLRASARSVQAVGAASYSLYLIHPFVVQSFGKVAAALQMEGGMVVIPAIAALVASVCVALAIHKLIELPVTDTLRRVLGHRRPIVEQADPLATKERDKLPMTQ